MSYIFEVAAVFFCAAFVGSGFAISLLNLHGVFNFGHFGHMSLALSIAMALTAIFATWMVWREDKQFKQENEDGMQDDG